MVHCTTSFHVTLSVGHVTHAETVVTPRQVLAAVCLLKPDRFRGVIMTGPMLGIEDDVRPPPLVEFVLRRMVAPILPTWPITPGGGEEAKLMACRDREVCLEMFEHNDLGLNGAKLRLKTAVELGIVGCTWIQERLPQFDTPFVVMHAVRPRAIPPGLLGLPLGHIVTTALFCHLGR